MKNTLFSIFILVATCLFPQPAFAAKDAAVDAQNEYEHSIDSVVRNKYFYKPGHMEVTGLAGVMPYDSTVNHYMLGGRFTWHLSDHYGWEVLDAQMAFPSVTGFTTNLANQYGISNLQISEIHFIGTTNFLASPIYGKIRFFGTQVLYFDIYLVGGGGFAKTETLMFSTQNSGVAATQSSLRTGMDPVFDFGLGFKVFMNNAMGLVIDLRDYVTDTQLYGSKTLKSNYSVFAGVSFFIPSF